MIDPSIIDTGSIEIFLNGGRVAIPRLIPAPSDATGLNLTAFGGSVQISDVRILSV